MRAISYRGFSNFSFCSKFKTFFQKPTQASTLTCSARWPASARQLHPTGLLVLLDLAARCFWLFSNLELQRSVHCSRVRIAASSILVLSLSSSIRTLVSGDPDIRLEPVLQPGEGFRPWQQLLLSDEDATWLPNSCHLPRVRPCPRLGISWLCKASCQS